MRLLTALMQVDGHYDSLRKGSALKVDRHLLGVGNRREGFLERATRIVTREVAVGIRACDEHCLETFCLRLRRSTPQDNLQIGEQLLACGIDCTTAQSRAPAEEWILAAARLEGRLRGDGNHDIFSEACDCSLTAEAHNAVGGKDSESQRVAKILLIRKLDRERTVAVDQSVSLGRHPQWFTPLSGAGFTAAPWTLLSRHHNSLGKSQDNLIADVVWAGAVNEPPLDQHAGPAIAAFAASRITLASFSGEISPSSTRWGRNS